MRRFLPIFFLFAALAANAAVKIVHQPHAQALPGAAALVYDAEGILRRVLHFNYPKGSELTVIFVPKEKPPAPLIRRGAQWYLECFGQDMEHFCSYGELDRLFSAMTVAGYGVTKPKSDAFLPPWITAAFREQLQASKGRERVFRSNRSALSVGALLENPADTDLSAILRLDPVELSPAEEKFYREAARMTLETAGAKHLLRPYLTRCAEGDADAAEKAFEETFSAAQKEKAFRVALFKAGRSWLWRENFPRPAEQLLNELQAFRRAWTLPELDESGKLTGKDLTLPLNEVTPLLARRPDGITQAKLILLRLHEFSSQDNRWFRNRFPKVSILVMNLPKQPELAAELETFLDQAEEQFQWRKKLEAYLMREEEKHTPAQLLFFYSLAEANRPPAAETDALVRWLDQVGI